MFSAEIVDCLVAHSLCISALLSLSQVCRDAREYIDTCWTRLIVGKMQAVYTMCNPPDVKVFVLTYNGFHYKYRDDFLDKWRLSFQRRDKDWCRTCRLDWVEGARAQILELTPADLFNGDNEAHLLIHLFQEGHSKCPVLFDALVQCPDLYDKFIINLISKLHLEVYGKNPFFEDERREGAVTLELWDVRHQNSEFALNAELYKIMEIARNVPNKI